jgi:hypothetical protein
MAMAAAVLFSLGAAGCSRSSSPEAGRLTVEGQAEVFRPGEERREVTGSRNLEPGDRVRVRQGTAVIRLPDDRRVELRMGTDVELQAATAGKGVRPMLLAGDLLVVSDGEPLILGTTGAEVSVHGDARVSRGLALLTAVYEGRVELRAGDSTLAVPALRQAAIPPTGQFPAKVTPLEYSPGDAWDQRYLSDTIELTNQLNARSQGFTAQLGPTEGRSFNYFRDLFPQLAAEAGFTPSLVNPGRLPGETLVGAAITLEGTQGTFAERWVEVFTFRDEGAAWGLVALDQGVRQASLLEAIQAAIGRGPSQFAEGPPPSGTPGSLAPPSRNGTATTVAAPGTSTTTTAPRRPNQPVTTTTTLAPTTPTTVVPGGPVNTGSPVIDETINSLVDALAGLLRSLGQQ